MKSSVLKKKRKRRTKDVLFLRNIPRTLKAKFKSLCALRGDSMQDVLEALIRLYHEKPHDIEKFLDVIKLRKEKQKARREMFQ